MLTRAGWAVAIGAVVGAAAGRLLGVTELYVLAAIAGALVLVAVAWVRRPVPRLAIERHVSPSRVVAGGAARVEVRITNQGPRRLPPIAIVDPVEGTVGARMAVGPLAAGSGQDVGYRLPPLRRGLFRVGPLRAEVIDPFGLARRRLPGVTELAITVLPTIDPAPTLPRGGGRHEPLAGLSRRVASASGVEDLVTLRPYVVGDDLRRVHWPSTAHADELQVRRDEERWQGHLAVLLDTRTDALDPGAFEQAVSVAAGIVDAVADSGDRVRLTTTGGMDSGMVDAQRSARVLLEDLALLDQDLEQLVELPQADVRRPVTIILLAGASSSHLAAAVHDAGFRDVIVVRFGDGAGSADGVGRGHDSGDPVISVGAGEPFAAAWQRDVAPGVVA